MAGRGLQRLIAALRAAPPLAVLSLGWAWLLVAAFPGQMLPESFGALRQARSRFINEETSPAFSHLWRAVEVFVAGPSGMLLLQATLFALGTYLLLRRLFANATTAAWLTTAILVFPPVQVPMGTVTAFAMMTALLVIGLAGVQAETRRASAGGLAAFFVAAAIQPSALLAILPLLLGFAGSADQPKLRRYAYVGAVWIAIAVGAFAVNQVSAPRWRATAADRSASTFAEALGLRERDMAEVIPPREIVETESALKLGVPTRSTLLQDGATAAHRTLAAYTPLFAPWLYVLLTFAFLVLARHQRAAVTLFASGLAFEATLFVTARSGAFYQSLWLVVCACIGLIAYLARRTSP